MIDVATLAAALALVKASGGGGSGEPGFSPTVEIAEVEGGTQVTITDVNGPQTFTVLNGANGTNGVNGQDGQDGVSPVLSIGEVTTLAAGSQATASLGGTAANPTLNLGIPQGAQGAQGAPGLDAPQIDDTQITTTNPWSSMKIVNTVCPAFTVSGPAVQCTPVANYPLGVQVEITPTQEGTGNPSPENVRPIVGWDEVTVQRSGKNVLNVAGAFRSGYNYVLPNAALVCGATYTYTCSTEVASGVKVGLFVIADNYPLSTYLGPGESASFIVPENTDFSQGIWLGGSTLNALDGVPAERFMVEIGSTPTSYAPYTGTTATLTLPETIYGGTVDVVTGVGSEEWSSVINLSSLNNLGILEDYANETTMLYYIATLDNMQSGMLVCCSHLPVTNIVNSSNTNIGIYGNPDENMAYIRLSKETASNLNEFKQWVDAQYAAGTPVTIAYKLATPTAFQATGAQSIPALPGTNTLFADAGDITVTGASDPIATITALQNRVSALESATLN